MFESAVTPLPDPLDAPQTTPTSAASAPARLKTLLYTAPLHELELNKRRRQQPWAAYDLRQLQLAALETVVDHMGLEGSAPRPLVLGVLQDLAARMAPQHPAARHRQVAATVLGWLLNEQDRAAGFQYEYGVVTDQGDWARQRVSVELLRERQAADGSLVLRASTEAINLIIGSLGIDVADAQKAEELLLDQYIADGRWSAAEQAARRARLRSIQYAEHLQHVLDQTRLDVQRVDWRQSVPQAMREALAHLRGRLDEEMRIRQRLDSMRSEMHNTPQVSTVIALADLIDDCQARHAQLHTRLLGGYETFLAEQQRQRFAHTASVALVSLSRDLLEPLLLLPPARAAEVGGVLFRAMLGPRPTRVLDAPALLRDLLAPRRPAGEDALVVPERELDLQRAAGRFLAAAQHHANAVLRHNLVGPQRLSRLLGLARQTDAAVAGEAAELIRLSALWAFAPEASDGLLAPRGMLSTADGVLLDDPIYGGDDLLVEVVPAQAELVTDRAA